MDEQRIAFWTLYAQSGGNPGIHEWLDLDDEDRVALAEASRRVKTDELGALAVAIHDPLEAFKLAGKTDAIEDCIASAAIEAIREKRNAKT